MKKINPEKIRSGLFFGLRWTKEFFSEFIHLFSRKEKYLSIIFIAALIVSGGFLFYQKYLSVTKEAPNNGGTYTEGVIAKSKDDLTDTVNRLTKIGLTKFDEAGNIVPAAASSWQVSDDVKTYTFTIDKKFSRDEILAMLDRQKDKWPGIEIKPQDEDKIIFRFNDSYSPFLASTTLPVLNYGPYKLSESNSSQFKFVANSQYYLGKPYIDQIIIKIYPDKENLDKAYKEGQVNGVYLADNTDKFSQSNIYSFKLPRYNMLFFNTQREALKDSLVRKKIANGEKFDNELKLVMVILDTEKNRIIANDIIQKWQKQNINITAIYKNPTELIDVIIPKRDYDVLIYGLDYGVDPDPYPFWHSTQASSIGLNLSNFSNIDADKALEEARKTLNKDTRKQKYDEFWKIFNDEVPAIILSQDEWKFAVGKKIKNVQTGYSITPEDRYLKVDKWYINTKRVKK